MTQSTDWFDDLYSPDDPDDLLTDEEFMAKYPVDDRPLDPDAAPASSDDTDDDDETSAIQDDTTDAAPAVDQAALDKLDELFASGAPDTVIDRHFKESGFLGGPEVQSATKPDKAAENLDATLDELFAKGASDAEIDRAMAEGGAW